MAAGRPFRGSFVATPRSPLCSALGEVMNQSASASNVKRSYAIVERNAKIISAVAILLFMPRLILAFTDLDTFLGLTYQTALVPMAVATAVYTVFLGMYWKCPACKAFPGGGWSREKCKKCGVELK